jgi:hypothetical protein
MLLQEKHSFDLHYGKNIEEDSSKSHLECSSNNIDECMQRRSTFDLTSFHRSSSSLSSSASSSTNTLYVSSPKSQRTYVRNNTTLRYRGPLSTKDPDESTSTSSGMITSNNTSNQNTTSNINANNNRNDDEDGSVVESTLGGNFLGCGHLIVILLHLIVTIERYVRRILREAGFVYASLFASSFSFQQEPVNDDDEDELSSSTSAPPMQDDDEDYSSSGYSSSSSSSSSCDDDEHQTIDADGWGHFADFQEELADESSFIPSCSRSNSVVPSYRSVTPPSPNNQKGALETLTESREEEDEEDWSF